MEAFPQVDTELCSGCGACVPVCVNGCISLEQDVATLDPRGCILCEHCVAACPAGALRSRLEPAEDFGPFAHDQAWMPPGDFDQAELVRLMRSRRSCRNFTSRPLELSILKNLCQVAATAPSGTNSQRWTFTILPERSQVMALGSKVAAFFRRLNSLAEIAPLRAGLALVGQKELAEYHREYYRAVKDALERYESHGEDRLFHGAPATIIVGSRPGASCPAEDAMLATQNLLLAAHALGLGTCLIGYAVEAMRRTRSIQKSLGWDKKEEVYSVIALGFPDEQYTGLPGRKELLLRVVEDTSF